MTLPTLLISWFLSNENENHWGVLGACLIHAFLAIRKYFLLEDLPGKEFLLDFSNLYALMLGRKIIHSGISAENYRHLLKKINLFATTHTLLADLSTQFKFLKKPKRVFSENKHLPSALVLIFSTRIKEEQMWERKLKAEKYPPSYPTRKRPGRERLTKCLEVKESILSPMLNSFDYLRCFCWTLQRKEQRK